MPATTYKLEDLKLNAYRVWVANPHMGTGQDLTSICTGIQWDYDLDQACEKFTLTFVKVRDLARQVRALDHIYILGIKVDSVTGIGSKIEPLKFGIIIDGGVRTNARGELQITAYDIIWYLTANKSSHMIMAESASTFFKRICGKYGIAMGHVDETNVIVGPAPLFEQQIYEMFVSALALTRDVAFEQRIQASGGDPTKFPLESRGPRFYLRTQVDKVALLAKKDPAFIWKFDSSNILEGQSKWSASTYRNAVQVYRRGNFNVASDGLLTQLDLTADGDISILATVPSKNSQDVDTEDKDIKNFGLLMESVSLVGASDPQLKMLDDYLQAQYQASELYIRLKRITNGGTITTVNINGLGPGDPVYIEEPVSGLVGKFYVKSGMHRVTGRDTTMALTVSLEDLLPEAYKTKPESSSSLFGGPLY